MYKELDIEILRKGMNKKILAKKANIRYQTLIAKLQGKYPITFDECLKIKEALNSDLPLEILFSTQ